MNVERAKSWGTFALMVALIGATAAGLRYALTPRHFSDTGTPDPNILPLGTGIRVVRAEFAGFDDKTRKAWIVRADTLDVSSDRTRIEARGNVEAELLDPETGKRRAQINAPVVVFTRNSQTLQVGGKIVCRAPGIQEQTDLRVEAQTLIWNVGAKQVFCPGTVQAQLPNAGGTARGNDLTLDLTTRATTWKRFHGEFAVGEASGTKPPAFGNPLKGLPF